MDSLYTIWANRLMEGTKTWADVPKSRKAPVLAKLEERVEAGELTEERLAEITAE